MWSQVRSYFNSFIIVLTATPDKRTFALFDENIVSEYPREQAIVDSVNVSQDIYLTETKITKNGEYLMKQMICHGKKTESRWQRTDASGWKTIVWP